MNSDFKKHILSVIDRYQMLSCGDTVIVGLSGGADSTSLLYVLNEIKSEYNLTLIAAHINHGLRGEEAFRDERFAGEFCKKLGIDYRVLHADVPAMSASSGESFEACGRRVRYDFFLDIAKDIAKNLSGVEGELEVVTEDLFSGVKIATAHNAQDAAETLIFNLARGSGLRGLCSIPPKRSFDDQLLSLQIIRPLIETTRDEIEAYLADNDIEFVNDSTNFETDYARNRIRHNILPELEKLNSKAIKNIARCTESLRIDEIYLDLQAEQLISDALLKNGVQDSLQDGAWNTSQGGSQCSSQDSSNTSYNAEILLRAPTSVRSRAIGSLLFEKSGVHQEKSHIDSVCKLLSDGGAVQVSGGLYVAVRHGILQFPPLSDELEKTDDFSIGICLKNNGFTDNFLGAQVKISSCTYDEFLKFLETDKQIFKKALDYDRISGEILLRNRRDGDRFRLPKRHVTKTLKNLFNENKIPVSKRSKLLMLVSNGEIAFLEGFGPSEKYVVTKDTKNVLIINIVRGD